MMPTVASLCRLAPAALLLSCATVQPPPPVSGRPLFLLQQPSYDGFSISGRLLVGAEGGPIQLDSRMIEAVVLEVVSVRDCATGKARAFMVMDTRARYPTEEQILTLEPGFWYGRLVHLPLFGPRRGYLAAYRHGPPCVEVDLRLHALRASAPASLQLRIEEWPTSSQGASPTE